MKSKRIIAIVIAAVLLLSVTPFALAASVTMTSGVGSANKAVEVKVINLKDDGNVPDDPTDPTDPSYVYSVDVTWESLQFTYKGRWDAAAGDYEAGGQWSKDGTTWAATANSNVTVTNHSNINIATAFRWDDLAAGVASNTIGGATFTLGTTSGTAVAESATKGIENVFICPITASGTGKGFTTTFTEFDKIIVSLTGTV